MDFNESIENNNDNTNIIDNTSTNEITSTNDNTSINDNTSTNDNKVNINEKARLEYYNVLFQGMSKVDKLKYTLEYNKLKKNREKNHEL